MRRPPRDAAAQIVSRALAIRLTLASIMMAALAFGVVAWGEDRYTLVIATAIGLTTLSGESACSARLHCSRCSNSESSSNAAPFINANRGLHP